MNLNTPVLLLTFNRLEATQEMFQAICEAKPSKLYIASDGPRSNKLGEDKEVSNVRDYILNNISWPCTVNTLFQERNLGCRDAVVTAINWFFENEIEGIILEDDCVPNKSFFLYVEDLLSHYRDDKRVMAISGNNILGDSYKSQFSYTFSRYSLMWGWATWRRAWNLYDPNMTTWPKYRDTNWLYHFGNGSHTFRARWKWIFDQVHDGYLNTWDIQWIYACWLQNGLAILPTKNLVRNIGFTSEATHTKNYNHVLSNLTQYELKFPLKHPQKMVIDYELDKTISKDWFRVNFFSLIRERVYSSNSLSIINNYRKALKNSKQKSV